MCGELTEGIEIINLGRAKRFEQPRIIALKQHGGGCRQRRLTHLQVPRDATPESDPAGPGCGCKVPILRCGPDEIDHTPYSSDGSRRPAAAARTPSRRVPPHSHPA